MKQLRAGVLVFSLVMVGACGGDAGEEAGANPSGTIAADGSSTVYPITEAVAEEFMLQGGPNVTVGESGTGGGFDRFCSGETEISNASRPIEDEERTACQAAGVEPVELRVAWDGLAVMVNPANTFVQCLTVAELKRIWEPGSTVTTWQDVRPEWPAQPIALYGPGTNSGTFDYFTEAVVGEADASRADYSASEDDNVLVQGVAGDANALGYFGYAYYTQNQDRLKLVGVDQGSGCVTPSTETIVGGQYAPLSRPLLIYVNKADLARPEVREFVQFYLDNAATLAEEVGYVRVTPQEQEAALQTFTQAISE